MATIVDTLSLDVVEQNLMPPVYAKQYDSNSRFLDVTITKNGHKITVESTATVYINVLRADGERDSFSGTVNEAGTVRVPINSWALALDDLVKASISIEQNDTKLTTLSFQIDVQAAETNNPDA